jgi:sugar lactone lactonase YvrE
MKNWNMLCKLICILTLFGSGVYAKELMLVEKVASQLSSPVGMAFDRKGILYIANWSGNRIDCYQSGKLEVFAKDIPSPSGLAIDHNDNLYVATYSSGFIYKIADKRQSVFLSGLSVVAGIYFDRNKNLLVAERGKGRVLAVSPKGEVAVLIDKGLKTPVAAIQMDNNRYVINDITGTTYLYDVNKKNLKVLGEVLKSPAIGLIIDPFRQDSILTVDYGDKGLYRISLDGKTELLTDRILSPVGLAMNSNTKEIFAATWGDNSLYKITVQ